MEVTYKVRDNIGTGYIAIPEGVQREEFISSCFNKEKFSIILNDGSLVSNVLCSTHLLNDIKFPNSEKELGSQIVYLNYPVHNVPIIIGIISKQGVSNYRNQNELILSKNNGSNEIGLKGNTILSTLKIFCKNILNSIAEFCLEVSGNEDSKLTLQSSGWIISTAKTGIKIKSNNKEITIDKDKLLFTNGKKQSLQIDSDKFLYKDNFGNKFTLNEKGYYFGNINFVDFNEKILNFLGNDLILNTPYGPTSPGTSSTVAGSKLQQIVQELQQINKE